MTTLFKDFKEIDPEDVAGFGGKATGLARQFRNGEDVPPGGALHTDAYFDFIEKSGVAKVIEQTLQGVNFDDDKEVERCSETIKAAFEAAVMPDSIAAILTAAYAKYSAGGNPLMAVRSSGTAEDLADASFAGQHRTILNVSGNERIISAAKACWASLFEPEAIVYRARRGFDQTSIGLSPVIQEMVQSEVAGVMFTCDPVKRRSGYVSITAVYGLGEGDVSGEITPDEYLVHVPTMTIVRKSVSPQELMLVNDPNGADGEIWVNVPAEKQDRQKLSDDQIIELATIGLRIMEESGTPRDIEWARAARKYSVLQDRPCTTLVHDENDEEPEEEMPVINAPVLLEGIGRTANEGVGTGRVVYITCPEEQHLVHEGDVLLTEVTSQRYERAMGRASVIITTRGGPNCHAGVLAREEGIACIVGAKGAIEVLKDAGTVTVDTIHRKVYAGEVTELLEWWDRRKAREEERLAHEVSNVVTDCKVYAIVGNPENLEQVAQTNAQGIGLARSEGIHEKVILRHPAAFKAAGEDELYIETLARVLRQYCRTIPGSNVYRLFEPKSDEQDALEGSAPFITIEANPMLGLRGIAWSLANEDVFMMELEALRRVVYGHGDETPCDNLIVMVPMLRTRKERNQALRLFRKAGLERSRLPRWMMAETPSSVLILERLIGLYVDDEVDEDGNQIGDGQVDGFCGVSVGTNDLTQFILAVDRNNGDVADIGDELDEAVQVAIDMIAAKVHGYNVEHPDDLVLLSLCGDMAGKHPETVESLVARRFTSISVAEKFIDRTILKVAEAERKLAGGQLLQLV